MKKYYRAIATLTDGRKEWDVVIYSLYASIAEAEAAIERFRKHGYNIVKTEIVPFFD